MKHYTGLQTCTDSLEECMEWKWTQVLELGMSRFSVG
jgi:hypothetical protein